jgi:hypothetical protein
MRERGSSLEAMFWAPFCKRTTPSDTADEGGRAVFGRAREIGDVGEQVTRTWR